LLADFACGEGLDDFSIVLEVEHLLDLLVRKFGKVFPKRLLKAPCLHGELQRRLAQRDKQDTHDWRSGGHDKARVIKRGGKGATAAMEARAAQMDNDWRAPPIPGEDIEDWREPQPSGGDQKQEQADRFSAEADKGAKVRYESENLTDDWRREELEHAYDEIPPHE